MRNFLNSNQLNGTELKCWAFVFRLRNGMSVACVWCLLTFNFDVNSASDRVYIFCWGNFIWELTQKLVTQVRQAITDVSSYRRRTIKRFVIGMNWFWWEKIDERTKAKYTFCIGNSFASSAKDHCVHSRDIKYKYTCKQVNSVCWDSNFNHINDVSYSALKVNLA